MKPTLLTSVSAEDERPPSPELVALMHAAQELEATASVPPASVARRVWAAIVDLIVVVILAYLTSFTLNTREGELRHLALLCVCYWLPPVCEFLFCSSPGKYVGKLVIARRDGLNPSLQERLIRLLTVHLLPLCMTVLFFKEALSSTFEVPPLFDGVFIGIYAGVTILKLCDVTYALNRSRLMLHDVWSGTTVYRLNDRAMLLMRSSTTARAFEPIVAPAGELGSQRRYS